MQDVHENISGLHRLGLVDDATMAEFDAACLVSEPTDEEVRSVLTPAAVRG